MAGSSNSPEAAIPSSGGRILVVDDDPILRFELASSLRQAGFRVREACSASEALTILKGGGGTDLLVTDIEMPGERDGLALAKAVRGTMPEIRIIVVSGTRPERGIVGVADVFFGKPYDAARLVERVRLLLQSPSRGATRRRLG